MSHCSRRHETILTVTLAQLDIQRVILRADHFDLSDNWLDRRAKHVHLEKVQLVESVVDEAPRNVPHPHAVLLRCSLVCGQAATTPTTTTETTRITSVSEKHVSQQEGARLTTHLPDERLQYLRRLLSHLGPRYRLSHAALDAPNVLLHRQPLVAFELCAPPSAIIALPARLAPPRPTVG